MTGTSMDSELLRLAEEAASEAMQAINDGVLRMVATGQAQPDIGDSLKVARAVRRFHAIVAHEAKEER